MQQVFNSKRYRVYIRGSRSSTCREYIHEVFCRLANNASPNLGISSCWTRLETTFEPVYARDWMREHPGIPFAACLVYALFIVLGQRFFASRKAWNWRGPMAAWNLGLSAFSFVGLTRSLPQLIHNYTHYSLAENFCVDPESHFGSGSTGLWVLLFTFSKFPELLDSFFIVIHKKPLIFLHWYHHLSVLLYCWHAYVNSGPVGLVFLTMNYAVHSLMYFYYFLMAVHLKPKTFKAMYITVAQISQMVVGTTLTTIGCYYLWWKTPNDGSGVACWLTWDNNIAGLVMYGSYLLLFVKFFFQRYHVKATKKSRPLKVE